MKESMLAYVVGQLRQRKGDWSVVAKKTRISKRTIEKIADGTIVDPRISKIETLAAYFRGLPAPVSRSELRA